MRLHCLLTFSSSIPHRDKGLTNVSLSTSSAPLDSLHSVLAWVCAHACTNRQNDDTYTHTGPLIGRWNFFLERNYPLRLAGNKTGNVSLKALSKRVAADQLFMAPIGVRRVHHPRVSRSNVSHQLTLFLGSMGIMEGRDSAHIKGKFKDLYMPLIMANWQVWPLAQVCHCSSKHLKIASSCTLVAHQLPLYAPALPSSIPVVVRCVLDTVSVYRKFKVRNPLYVRIYVVLTSFECLEKRRNRIIKTQSTIIRRRLYVPSQHLRSPTYSSCTYPLRLSLPLSPL